jgi:hypothetical protein
MMTESFWKSVINLFCLFLSLFLLWIRKHRAKHLFVWYITDFPVFLLHELSHYLIAFLLGARPELPSFQIKEEKEGYVMGSVTCHNLNPFNSLPAGLAPLFLLIPAYWITFHTSLPPGLKILILLYLLPASRPSLQDFKIAFRLLSVLLWLFLLLCLYLATRFLILKYEPILFLIRS